MYSRNNATVHLSLPVWNILGWNCLDFAFKPPCLVKAIITFHDSEILQSPAFCDVPAFHGDQTVAWVATTLYESRILGFTTEFLALPKNIFLLFGQLSSYVWALAAVSQAKLFRAFSSRTRVEELNSLSRTMDRLYPLFFKCPSSDAIAISLLLGFLVRNPHRVCF